MANKRGTSWEGAFSHKGERYRRSFPTEEEADLWVLENKARAIRGEPVDMGDKAARRKDGLPFTLTELIEHVYKTHWAPMAGGEKAIVNARSIVAEIDPNKPVAKLTKADIDEARAALLKHGNSPATVNRKVAALSKALSEAEDLAIIDRKPKCSRYKESEHRIRRFTPDEERLSLAFFDRISQQDMADYLVLSLDTGMRQAEVLGAYFDDFHDGRVTAWGTGQASQRTKSGRSRSIKLTNRASEVIARRRSMLGSREVFPSLNRWGVQHYWDRLSEALGLDGDKHFVPHILRHEFCSRLAARGINASTIQALAGHSSLTITQRYVHLFGTDLDTAILDVTPSSSAAQSEAMQRVAELPQETLELLKLAGILPGTELPA